MNHFPQFSRRLIDLLAERGLPRIAGAELCGLSRPVFTRLLQGGQWPQPDQLQALFRLASSPAQRAVLEQALHADVSAASGLSRFGAVEESPQSPHVVLRVPREHAALVEDVLLLIDTDATARAAIEALIPAFLRKRAVEHDHAAGSAASKTKLSTPAGSKSNTVYPKNQRAKLAS